MTTQAPPSPNPARVTGLYLRFATTDHRHALELYFSPCERNVLDEPLERSGHKTRVQAVTTAPNHSSSFNAELLLAAASSQRSVRRYLFIGPNHAEESKPLAEMNASQTSSPHFGDDHLLPHPLLELPAHRGLKSTTLEATTDRFSNSTSSLRALSSFDSAPSPSQRGHTDRTTP
jgi:hypothetical protein